MEQLVACLFGEVRNYYTEKLLKTKGCVCILWLNGCGVV